MRVMKMNDIIKCLKCGHVLVSGTADGKAVREAYEGWNKRGLVDVLKIF